MMPETFFSKLAEKSPFVIFQNQLYQTAEGDGRDGFVRAGSHKFGLFPGSTLTELERFYFNLHSNEIFEHKKTFIEERLRQEIKSNQEMQEYLNDNNVLRFILYEVFPFFIEKKSEIESLLKGKPSKEEKPKDGIEKLVKEAINKEDANIKVAHIREQLLKELRPLESKEPKISPGEEEIEVDSLLTDYYKETGVLSKTSSYKKKKSKLDTELSKILGNNDILVIKGLVYRLSPLKEKKGIYVNIKGQNYSLIPFSSVKEVENAYKNKLETQFKIQAVNEFQDQIKEIKEIRVQNKALEKFFEKKEYDSGTVGFKKEGDSYYVYVPVPEHVLKHPESDTYYRFDKCRVAVRVKHSDGRFRLGGPQVIESYSHPFLSDSGYSWQSICMGSFNSSKLRKLDDASAIATLLSGARNVLLAGYTASCSPHHNLENYTIRKISLREIKKRKLPVTNVHKDNSLWKKIKEVF